MRERARVGRYGENVACDLLQHKGFELVDRNWRCRHGELDIVAVDGRCVVAVEVKTRRSERPSNRSPEPRLAGCVC
jgi:putative endonuclease